MDNEISLNQTNEKINLLVASIEKIIRGKKAEITKVLTTLIAGGHILVEDNPGLGKTAMAKSLAFSISTKNSFKDQQESGTKMDEIAKHILFKRIQFTPDLLPMDLIGIHIFDDVKKEFSFKQGPLFANIILADEINRASPKVQSALLECMAEHQVTVGETTYYLDPLFFVIATQNPIEMEGTYPLPAAQLDRFFMKISFGYVSEEKEVEIYQNYLSINKIEETIKPVLTYDDIIQLQRSAENVNIHPEILNSVKNFVVATRKHHHVLLGASTRSGISFIRCLKAFALVNNRDYVIEDDLKALAKDVFNHRLIFKNKEAELNTVNEIVTNEIERLSKLKIK